MAALGRKPTPRLTPGGATRTGGQFCGNSTGLPPVGIGAPPAGIDVTGIIGDRPGATVMVVGIGWALMPEVIIWPLVAGAVAHCPLAHGLAAVVVFDPQQVLHPTAPK